MATYAIGDVQGCFNSLLCLLEKIRYKSTIDSLWFTGDLVNRGPLSLEVLRFVKSLRNCYVVLGNHDLHLLSIIFAGANINEEDTLTEILNAPDREELCSWLLYKPLLHHNEALGYTLVHAGLPPQWNLHQSIKYAKEVQSILQSKNYIKFFENMYGDYPCHWSNTLRSWDRVRMITNYFTRLRFCNANGDLDLSAKGLTTLQKGYFPWFQLPNRRNKDLRILFGHWAALNGKIKETGVYALDTGCVWGNCLTAMRLEDKKYFSVRCMD